MLDDRAPAEGLLQTAKPPSGASFPQRFRLALLVSIGLHVLLMLLLPGIPHSTTVPRVPDPAMLSVSLTSHVPIPSQPVDDTELSQAVVQPPELEADPPMPTASITPTSPATPTAPIASTVHPEPAPVSTDSLARPDDTVQTSDSNPQTLSIQEPVNASEPPVPSASPGTVAQVPDTAKIGEEFKLAFMNLLVYPEAARRRGVQGTVGLRIIMDGEGRITEALVSQTSGSSILDRVAVSAALATPGPVAGPGRRLELAIRVSFEAGRVLARP